VGRKIDWAEWARQVRALDSRAPTGADHDELAEAWAREEVEAARARGPGERER